MSYYLGLDLSLTGTGVSIIDDSGALILSEKLSTESRGAERLYNLYKSLNSYIQSYSTDILLTCIEGPSYLSEKGHLFEIGEWTGCVKMLLYTLDIKYILATPQQLKKYILGKAPVGGGSKKELVILDVYKKYNVELRDNNIADAYVLSRIAHDYYLGEQELPTHQMEVMKALAKREKEESKAVVLK
jgi:Holliday junction resolvasome RuvABC endonuclease subunit